MKRTYFLLYLLVSLIFFSCIGEDTGEFQLAGDINKYITLDMCDIDCTAAIDEEGTTFIYSTVKANSIFETWGLYIKNIKFYVDNEYIGECSIAPYEYRGKCPNLNAGQHNLKGEITIGGEACNDAVINKQKAFIVKEATSSTEKFHLFMDHNLVNTNEYLKITPYIFTTNSDVYRITKVLYLWDGQLIGTSTREPFELTYRITEASGTKHNLQVTIYYLTPDAQEKSTHWTFIDYPIMSSYEYYYWSGLKWEKNIYNKTESIPIYARTYVGRDASEKLQFSLLIDERDVLVARTFPYDNNYSLSSLEEGVHTLTFKWSVTKNSSTTYISTQKEILIH